MTISCYAQKKKKKDNGFDLLMDQAQWYSGSIMLKDGTELEGVVKYDDQHGLLSFQNGEETRVFVPRNVVGFEFFDETIQKQRVFYSLEYEDPRNNVIRPLFFEVIKDFKRFAVLAKADPVKMEVSYRSYNNPANAGFGTAGSLNGLNSTAVKKSLSQIETIYILNDKGEITPYLEIKNEDVEGVLFSGPKSSGKVKDKDLLVEYVTEPVYDKLKDYARGNNLSFKRKEDLIKILDYYEGLLQGTN